MFLFFFQNGPKTILTELYSLKVYPFPLFSTEVLYMSIFLEKVSGIDKTDIISPFVLSS